jgi:outer membrane protein assembly factor BamB
MLQRCLTGSLNSERSIAVKTFHSVSLFVLLTSASAVCAGETWPQAAGPNGSWTTETHHRVPTGWSGSTGQNILWAATLDEGGQSGIAVSGDRMFLTINKPLPTGTTVKEAAGTDVVGQCFDAATGRKLWQVELPGRKPMPHSGLFSDNTSPTPVTDGRHVWFINAGGLIVCCTVEGKQVWSRKFETRTRHNAKNCEPMLYGNWLMYVSMRDEDDPARRPMLAQKGKRESNADGWPWTFVRAWDKSTGQPQWVAADGTSIHNTPTCGMAGGKPVLFHGRGGGHRPPEEPYGFSLTSLDQATPGETLWRKDITTGMAFFVTDFDDRFAYCFDTGSLVVLDINSGETRKTISLFQNVDVRKWAPSREQHTLQSNTSFKPPGKKTRSYPTNQTNIVVDGYCLFMSHEGHMIGRANIETGNVEYLQVPIQVVRSRDGGEQLLWDRHIPADTQNSRGIDTAADRRAKGDGWGHVTSASPIAINNLVYFSTMLGTVYVIDASAEQFDAAALVAVNDLGPAGKTWSLSSISYADGRLYHRGLKRLVCIAESP